MVVMLHGNVEMRILNKQRSNVSLMERPVPREEQNGSNLPPKRPHSSSSTSFASHKYCLNTKLEMHTETLVPNATRQTTSQLYHGGP